MTRFVEVHDIGHAGLRLQEFLLTSGALTNLTPYGYGTREGKWLPDKNFRTAEINYRLGKAAEEMLPSAAIGDLKNLSIGEFPRVVLLKGMPTGERGYDQPESGFPFCAMTLRAISALLVKRDAEWNSAYFASSVQFYSNAGTEAQQMHCDQADHCAAADFSSYKSHAPSTDIVYGVLHFVKTNGLTPTWFAPYNSDDAGCYPDKSRHIPVVANSGDVLIFNNLRVLHARGKSPKTDQNSEPVSPDRYFIAINMLDSYSPLDIRQEKLLARNANAELAIASL